MTAEDLRRHGAGRPVSGRPALARAVGPDLTGFAATHWGRRPLLRRAADPDAFRDLLDLDAVDELLSRRGLRTPFVRLARNGSVLDSSAFTDGGGVGAEIADQVRDDKVAALFADGSTVVLQGLHRVRPAVIDYCTGLAEELGHPVQANAYITPPSSRGFSAHYDVHDVLVLQLAGRKHWTVHAPVHPDPLRDQPWSAHAGEVAARAATDEPAIDTVLEPGDALYLPRGWLHAATALGETSAHLTVGIHVVTRFALVQALLAAVTQRLAADPGLRASLPLGLDLSDPEAVDGAVDDALAQVRAAAVRALAEVQVAPVARRVRDRVWAGSRPEPVGPVAQATFALGLAEGDGVRLRSGLRFRLVDGDDRVALELPDRRLSLPATTATALRAVLDGTAHQVGGLPGLDGADQVVLVRRLLREGVLVPTAR